MSLDARLELKFIPTIIFHSAFIFSLLLVSLLNNLLADSDVSRTVINEVVPEVLIKFQEPMYNILDRGLDDAIEILS